MRTAVFRICVAAGLLAAGYIAGRLTPEPVAEAAQAGRVFEMRTYTTNEGKLPALESRFRDHTIKFFDKYDMKSIGYWAPQDGPTSQTTLVHILAHPSREADLRCTGIRRADRNVHASADIACDPTARGARPVPLDSPRARGNPRRAGGAGRSRHRPAGGGARVERHRPGASASREPGRGAAVTWDSRRTSTSAATAS